MFIKNPHANDLPDANLRTCLRTFCRRKVTSEIPHLVVELISYYL